MPYLSLGSTFFFCFKTILKDFRSIGLKTTTSDAGYLSNISFGLIGLWTNPPPQLGQTFSIMLATQSTQKVHSKVQIIAS